MAQRVWIEDGNQKKSKETFQKGKEKDKKKFG